MSIWTNLRKRGLRDLLNPKKWWIYFRFLRKKVKEGYAANEPYVENPDNPLGVVGVSPATLKEYSELTILHEFEQIVYRMMHLGCRPCLQGGECTHCGCKSPDLFYDRSNWCSGMFWDSMLDEEKWREFKELNNIELNTDYITQVKQHGKIIKFIDDGRNY